MEGRPATLHPETGSYRARVDSLVRADRGAQFRDATIGQATAILVAVVITLAVAAGLWFRFARRTPVTLLLAWASLGLIGYVTATFLAGLLPFFKWGSGPYFLFVVLVALAIAGLCLAIGRRGPVDPVLIALGIVVVLHVGDLVSGTRLQFNTVFGYSPTVGIRLAGIGNPGSAQVSICALLFAILIAWRLPRRGAAIGYGVLGVDAPRDRRADVGPGLRRRTRARADARALVAAAAPSVASAGARSSRSSACSSRPGSSPGSSTSPARRTSGRTWAASSRRSARTVRPGSSASSAASSD